MTITKLNIVQDCWWTNDGSATNYVTNNLGQKNSEITSNAFYLCFSPSPFIYLQFNGSGVSAPSYYCRLETNNMVPEQVRVGINGSCANGNTWATVGINGMTMGSFGNFGSISTQSGVFNLTTAQKERILNGRISDNYDYFSVKLERSGVLSSSRIVDIEVYYSGNYSWDNYSTGLSGISTLYCYPESLSFRNSSVWANQAGSTVNSSGYYHIDKHPSGISVDTTYITHTNPPGYSYFWAGGPPMPSGGLSFVCSSDKELLLDDGSALLLDDGSFLLLDYDGTLLSSLSQVTRAKMNLRMSLPQSGLYPLGHYRDCFEINGYKNNKYYIYGAGAIVEQSGFKTYTTELNFLNPDLPNGELSSTIYKNMGTFNGMEFQLVGLPSGVQLSAAQLELEYIPDNTIPLYTYGYATATSGIPLYTFAVWPSAEMPLYIYSKIPDNSSGNLQLYTYASPAGTGAIYYSSPLYMYGLGRYTTMPLYLLAPTNSLIPTADSGNISLYTIADSGSAVNNLTLYVEQRGGENNLSGYMWGHSVFPSSIPLYIFGSGLPEHNTVELYTHGF